MRDTPLREWLKEHRETNNWYMELMALSYDLEGALDADQPGLAWWTQEDMLVKGLRLFLLEAGCPVPPVRDRVEHIFDAVEVLGRTNPALAGKVWDLLMRPAPEAAQLRPEIDRTLRLLAEDLGFPWVLRREEAVLRWAASTSILRTVAAGLRMAQADDWYLGDSATPDLDWYSQVVRTLEEEQAQDDRAGE